MRISACGVFARGISILGVPFFFLPSSSSGTLPATLSRMAASALLKSRVRRPSYLNKLAKAEDLIDLFPHGSYIGWSGFTGVGYPKYVFSLLVMERARRAGVND